MSNLKYLKCAMLVVIAASSCHTIKPAPEPVARPVPASFGAGKDTASDAVLNARQFFTDKYLVGLIDTTLANNWDMQIALQRVEAARSNVLLTKGALLPFVRAAASGGINRYSDYTMDGAGNLGTRIYDGRFIPRALPNYYVGIQTTWEADVWGRLRSKKKAALARFLATVEGKNIVITNLVTEIAAAYYELLALDNQLSIINETITLQENALEIVEVQKDVAIVSRLAVEQFESQLLASRSMAMEVQQQINETENRMNLLMGRYPQTIARDKTVLTGSLPAQVRMGIPTALLQNRPDLRRAEAELVAARADVKAAKAAFYPSLSVVAGAGFQSFKSNILFNFPQAAVYNLIGNLSAPLINRSALNAELKMANASQAEAIYNYQKLLTGSYTEVYTQMQKIKTLEQVYELRSRQVNILTQSIETSSELFKMGRSNYLEVLITQQTALHSKLERITTRRDQFQATINIYKALGGGWR